MTPPTYAELWRLLAEATGAPWKHFDDEGVKWDDPKACGYDSREHHRGPPYYATGPRAGSSEQADVDARLIAAMRNALPQLLAEAEAGRRLRAAVVHGIENACCVCETLGNAAADYDREVGT